MFARWTSFFVLAVLALHGVYAYLPGQAVRKSGLAKLKIFEDVRRCQFIVSAQFNANTESSRHSFDHKVSALKSFLHGVFRWKAGISKVSRNMLACTAIVLLMLTKSFKPAAAKPAMYTQLQQSASTSTSLKGCLNPAAGKTKKMSVEFVVAKHDQKHHTSQPAAAAKSNPSAPLSNMVEREVEQSWKQLLTSLEGAKLDSLIMLIATSLVIPLFKHFNTSPIVGFLLTGTLLGPGGLNWVRDVHMIDTLGELGIVFFLFEMGLELSLDRLKAMRKDVFGLGTSQFLLTSAAITLAALKSGLPLPAAFTIGGSLALSSSAFVLQLLKDKNAMGTRHGKASFGILLLQDLAVVPLIVVVQLLCAGGEGLGRALALAGVKALVALSAMSLLGKKLINPIFSVVAKASSHEAFLSIILTTVLLMSFVTKGIGLSDTLGAFLAGILLSETSYRYQIESDIAPFRGLLLGLFFITVGFSIDLSLLVQQPFKVLLALVVLIGGKASIITALSSAFGIPLASAVQAGLLNSQGGEFAFVSLGIAQRAGLIDEKLCKLLLTTVALSMALTPALSEASGVIAKKVEDNLGLAYYSGQGQEASQVTGELDHSSDFVFVCGYGNVGKMVCDMLDRKFIRYIVLENNPQIAIEARSKGLPVFFGDIHRPEVLKHFHVGDAKACVLTLSDMSATNKAVVRLRKVFPNVPIVARAKNPQHQKRLQSMFGK
ncbi:potassium transporter KefB [archaeon]|nr:MAG: potassium transporter KefB [archaeon]